VRFSRREFLRDVNIVGVYESSRNSWERRRKSESILLIPHLLPSHLGPQVPSSIPSQQRTCRQLYSFLPGVESVDRDEKDNLIEGTTGYLNRQIERLCIVIQGSERRRRYSNNTSLDLRIILVEAGVRLCSIAEANFNTPTPWLCFRTNHSLHILRFTIFGSLFTDW